MSMQFFLSKSRFYDDFNFPYGLDRSGDFTKKQAELLTQCGQTLRSLEDGKILPKNDAQMEFLHVLKGEAPIRQDDEVAKAWLYYKSVIEKKSNKQVHTYGLGERRTYFDEEIDS